MNVPRQASNKVKVRFFPYCFSEKNVNFWTKYALSTKHYPLTCIENEETGYFLVKYMGATSSANYILCGTFHFDSNIRWLQMFVPDKKNINKILRTHKKIFIGQLLSIHYLTTVSHNSTSWLMAFSWKSHVFG